VHSRTGPSSSGPCHARAEEPSAADSAFGLGAKSLGRQTCQNGKERGESGSTRGVMQRQCDQIDADIRIYKKMKQPFFVCKKGRGIGPNI
jgi:hypothetical protein